LFSLEFASHGAQVVGIEGREANNAVARKCADSLPVQFVTDDVRNFSRQRFGTFDVVVCSGILYHLPGEDGCRLIQSISEACIRLTIIDTHVGPNEGSVSFMGRTYCGALYKEHEENDSAEAKTSRAWASLDNPISFWITQPSLLNLLRDVGFSTVAEIHRPWSDAGYSDRVTIAAIKGESQRNKMRPETDKADEPNWPEVSNLSPCPRTQLIEVQSPWKQVARAIKRKIRH
jgi:hypothetical protein